MRSLMTNGTGRLAVGLTALLCCSLLLVAAHEAGEQGQCTWDASKAAPAEDCGHAAATPDIAATPSARAAAAVEADDGHGHSHGGNDHDHGHGHSHGAPSAKPIKQAKPAAGHGHSHGDGHGHSHGAPSAKPTKQAKPTAGHGHSHGGNDDGHGHSHGAAAAKPSADHGHSHGAAAAASKPTAGHGHSHGGNDDGHGHSHGPGNVHGRNARDKHRVLTEDEKHPILAIAMTTVAGLAASVGGIVIVLGARPSNTLLGFMLAFASGVMMYISYGDLLIHAQMEISFFQANAWMFVGMIFFGLIIKWIPEPDIASLQAGAEPHAHSHAHGGGDHGHSHAAPAVVEESAEDAKSRSRLFLTGLVAAAGVSLHNFPEGLVVYNSMLTGMCDAVMPSVWEFSAFFSYLTSCMGRGLAVTMAIGLHNIPEGVVVAMPIYSATNSKWAAMKWCLLSSLCEPVAAIVFGQLFHQFLTPYVMACVNAVVAGIMIMLCLVELLPATLHYIDAGRAAMANVFGQIVMFYSLYLLIETGAH